MPLKAMFDDEPFYAWNLLNSDRGRKFTCPGCGEDMTPVMPIEDIIKHFRHKSGRVHGEHETVQHILAKLWFKTMVEHHSSKSSCVLEHYMKRNDKIHILDCLVTQEIEELSQYPPKGLGVELQYSGISTREWRKRNAFYWQQGINIEWIFIVGDTYSPFRIYREYSGNDFEFQKNVQKIKKVEQICLKQYGHIYYLDFINDKRGVLLKADFRRVPGEWTDWGYYEPKTLGWFRTEEIICGMNDLSELWNEHPERERNDTKMGEAE